MNLEECLHDIERGRGGQKHADWLRYLMDCLEREMEARRDKANRKSALAALWKQAAKCWRDNWKIQKRYSDRMRQQRDEARDLAPRLERELAAWGAQGERSGTKN